MTKLHDLRFDKQREPTATARGRSRILKNCDHLAGFAFLVRRAGAGDGACQRSFPPKKLGAAHAEVPT